ncbi:MAG: dienelactone hydrolase family protein [Rhodovarius sp.]|nr:dienelactone hydrolase family protein [Rhodovarius sp.]MDW8315103.1 dienelactone hydrolase family protein [Rhodovarius sp.]
MPTAVPLAIPPAGLPGLLELPRQPRGIVVFAHGSGSGRMSPRNRAVAASLREAGFATLLSDLLSPAEAADRRAAFDIPLLAARLEAAARCAAVQPGLAGLPVGLFGASTGAAAALAVAAAGRVPVGAVVSRGGRPDLAGAAVLGAVRAPTLLLVGGADHAVLALNREALGHLSCPAELAVIQGAGHLFEEPGALEEVARLARGWFARWLLPVAADVAR